MTQILEAANSFLYLASSDSCGSESKPHEKPSNAGCERIEAAFSTLLSEIESKIEEIEALGTEAGRLEPYPRGGRVYYNHCHDDDSGKPVREYLPKAKVKETRAAIERFRQAQRLKAMRSEIERIRAEAQGEI